MTTRAHTVPRFYLSGFIGPDQTKRKDPFIWVGSLHTGIIQRRSPKNISTVNGYYDGVGAFANSQNTIEQHLAKIESEAAFAIRKFTASPIGIAGNPSPAIWRFLSWQAARTPGWSILVEEWMNESQLDATNSAVEPPPQGFANIANRPRGHLVEEPTTGRQYEVKDLEELQAYMKRGWKWKLTQEDRLECLHMQAWYFQVRHFPRLSWTRLDTPENESFITSDRAVAWLVDGYADTPPTALRHPSAQIVAPLTRKSALIGKHDACMLQITPREVNRFTAFAASNWIVGPSKEVVELAMHDRNAEISQCVQLKMGMECDNACGTRKATKHRRIRGPKRRPRRYCVLAGDVGFEPGIRRVLGF